MALLLGTEDASQATYTASWHLEAMARVVQRFIHRSCSRSALLAGLQGMPLMVQIRTPLRVQAQRRPRRSEQARIGPTLDSIVNGVGMYTDGRSLYWVFWAMGFNTSECKHLVKVLDRLRLCNHSAEDWNRRLRTWMDQEVMRSTSTVREQLRKVLGCPIDRTGPHVDRQLFDEDLRAG